MSRATVAMLLRLRQMREQVALRDLADQQAQLSAAQGLLSAATEDLAASVFPCVSPVAGFHTQAALRAAHAARVGSATALAAAARTEVDAAHEAWTRTHQHSDAAQRLVDRQRAQRRDERDRRDTREADDLAIARHLSIVDGASTRSGTQ